MPTLKSKVKIKKRPATSRPKTGWAIDRRLHGQALRAMQIAQQVRQAPPTGPRQGTKIAQRGDEIESTVPPFPRKTSHH